MSCNFLIFYKYFTEENWRRQCCLKLLTPCMIERLILLNYLRSNNHNTYVRTSYDAFTYFSISNVGADNQSTIVGTTTLNKHIFWDSKYILFIDEQIDKLSLFTSYYDLVLCLNCFHRDRRFYLTTLEWNNEDIENITHKKKSRISVLLPYIVVVRSM